MSASLLPATSHTAPLSVLVLDDERLDRHRLARFFSGLDYHCEITNTQDLLEFAQELERDTYALILLDYLLPDGTGFEAVEMVQLSARNLNTPMLMISAHGRPDLAEEAHTRGCVTYLSKEKLSKDSFSQAVSQALRPLQPVTPGSDATFDHFQVEQALSLCASRCARDVKPMVSRLMRQLRDLRARSTTEDPQTLRAIEQNCLSLWTFLIEMERQEGADLMAEFTTKAPKPDPVASLALAKPNRPPSPFSARRH